MYCPNCSAQNDKNQNFCRFCGLNLEETAKSLKHQLSFGQKAAKLKELDKLKRITGYTSICLIVFFVLGILALSFFDFDKTTFKSFIKISLGIYFVFYFSQKSMKYYQQQKTQDNSPHTFPTEQSAFGSKETSKLLEEKSFIPISSVTDNSTELLYTENQTRKLR